MSASQMVEIVKSYGVAGIDVIEIVEKSTWAVNVTLFILLIISIASWGIIIFKITQLKKAKEMTSQFARIMTGNYNYPDIYQSSNRLAHSPAASVFRKGYEELEEIRKDSERDLNPETMDLCMNNIERAMKKEGSANIARLENWLSFLAITSTISPFLGLFGTVWGIMNAFDIIGKTGSATLGTIAPSLSEALITTAFGLVAAIPAVVAFNLFSSSITKREGEAVEVMSDFLNYVSRRYGQ
ncbi:MAG: MotA/TolQ/ExbB proton channel family protein [bacterium]